MTINIAINGFGRIGRLVLRALLHRQTEGVSLVAINDLAPIETMAHLLEFDSIHGPLGQSVTIDGDRLLVGGHEILVTSLRAPEELPWEDVDIAHECTGVFTTHKDASRHLKNGSKKVLISAPGKEVDRTVVFGVNHKELLDSDTIVSNASCTTNCLAPVAMVLHQNFGIKTGYMTTVHSYTGDQPTHDSAHKDLYRARAAALSMVPTSTGAAKAISLVLPDLTGRLEGSAIRVPTANVSMVDLCVMPETPASASQVNAVMKAAAETALSGILRYEERPLVSADFNHDPHSSCFAPAQTTVTEGGMIRVVSWYDNEWGFSNRMIDTSLELARTL